MKKNIASSGTFFNASTIAEGSSSDEVMTLKSYSGYLPLYDRNFSRSAFPAGEVSHIAYKFFFSGKRVMASSKVSAK